MKMNGMKNRSSAGFTLIEVLLALVVAVVGILGMIQLSSVFLQTASESDRRAVATTVAEQTLENLRGFDNLSGSVAGQAYFENIATSSTAVSVNSGLATYDFTVEWNVSDFTVSGGMVSAGASGALYNMYKDVTVTVSWTEPTNGNVQLSSIIAGIDPNVSALALNDTSLGGSTPEVNYNPGVAPDVIAIDVADGKLKETTKPLPEVANKSQSTQVRFETITYTNTNTEVQLIQEDFVTVNCRCILDTDLGVGISPAYQKFIDADTPLIEVLGGVVSAARGTEASIGGGKSQSDFCGRCCAYHHDSASSNVKYSPYAGTASTGGESDGIDHPHYKIADASSDPILLEEAGDGDEYLEACRFKRIDGIYRLVQDWNLRAVNVFPSTYLASVAGSGLSDYKEYVKDYVKAQIFNVDLAASASSVSVPTLTTSPSLTLTLSDDDESISRSLYLDNIQSVDGLADYLLTLSAASIAEDTWLEFVPFNEVNTTQLSYWSEADPATATVTNQTIDSTYNRGLIEAVATGTTSVTASMAQGNTGILGNTYNAENDYPGWQNHITDISGGRDWIGGAYNPLPVVVSGASGSGTTYTAIISGNVTFYGQDNLATPTCGSSTGHGANLTMTYVSGTDPYYYTYSCVIGPVTTGDLYEAAISVSVNGQKAICPSGQFKTYTFGPTNVTSYSNNDFVVGKKADNCP